jgi:hypothetical protein
MHGAFKPQQVVPQAFPQTPPPEPLSRQPRPGQHPLLDEHGEPPPGQPPASVQAIMHAGVVQATHWPEPSHCSGIPVLHWMAPGVHTPLQDVWPTTHTYWHGNDSSCQVPVGPQYCR